MTSTLTVTQQVAAPVEAVYAAWLDADALATWWWVNIPDTTYEVDAREGGAYRVASAAAGIEVRGTFVLLEPPSTLEMSWTWVDDGVPGADEHVRVDLTPHDGGTLVTVTHSVASAAGVADYRQGWEHVLGNLARGPVPGVGTDHGPTRAT